MSSDEGELPLSSDDSEIFEMSVDEGAGQKQYTTRHGASSVTATGVALAGLKVLHLKDCNASSMGFSDGKGSSLMWSQPSSEVDLPISGHGRFSHTIPVTSFAMSSSDSSRSSGNSGFMGSRRFELPARTETRSVRRTKKRGRQVHSTQIHCSREAKSADTASGVSRNPSGRNIGVRPSEAVVSSAASSVSNVSISTNSSHMESQCRSVFDQLSRKSVAYDSSRTSPRDRYDPRPALNVQPDEPTVAVAAIRRMLLRSGCLSSVGLTPVDLDLVLAQTVRGSKGVLRRLADRSSGSNEASALILSTVASLNFSKPPGSNRKTAPASASVAKAVLKASGSRVPQGRTNGMLNGAHHARPMHLESRQNKETVPIITKESPSGRFPTEKKSAPQVLLTDGGEAGFTKGRSLSPTVLSSGGHCSTSPQIFSSQVPQSSVLEMPDLQPLTLSPSQLLHFPAGCTPTSPLDSAVKYGHCSCREEALSLLRRFVDLESAGPRPGASDAERGRGGQGEVREKEVAVILRRLGLSPASMEARPHRDPKVQSPVKEEARLLEHVAEVLARNQAALKQVRREASYWSQRYQERESSPKTAPSSGQRTSPPSSSKRSSKAAMSESGESTVFAV